ncbi:MAG: hypothetical protein ACI87E_000449 [Mariniblastus sp.]|jgi:hypothetical protein
MSHLESNPIDFLKTTNGNYMASHHNDPERNPQADGRSVSVTQNTVQPISAIQQSSTIQQHFPDQQSSRFEAATRIEPKQTPQYESIDSSYIYQPPKIRPIWDKQKRELRYGDKLVKQFKWPALNQECVLNAFQEMGWPKEIDDPLSRDPKICPKRRLHDTLKCLNRKQANGIIKFRGDGTGEGVRLEINWPLEPKQD